MHTFQIGAPAPFLKAGHDTVFQTSDFNLAAYLHARSYELLGINTFQGRFNYTFDKGAKLGAEGFYSGASAPAKALLHAAERLEEIRKKTTIDE